MEERKHRILRYMFKAGLCMVHEIEEGSVSEEKIQMYIKGIKRWEGDGTIKGEIEARIKLHEETGISGYKKEVKKIMSIDREVLVLVRGNQTETILNHLRIIGGITTMEAIRLYGCTRLADKIFMLKNRGYQIKTVMTEGENRYGEKVRFAKYLLSDNEI